MSDCSKNRNPLQRTGTSQMQRLLPGLNPGRYALADERAYADWIAFAEEYASFVSYYDTGNQINGNWQAFFNSDISAHLGIIAIQNIDRYRKEIKERFDFIRDDSHQGQMDAIRLKLNELYSALFTLSKALDKAQLRLPAETALKSAILNVIRIKLAPALKRLTGSYLAAGSAPLDYLNHASLSNWKILNLQLTDAGGLISEGLSESWLFDTTETTWAGYVNSIEPDDSIFNDPIKGFTDAYLSIQHAANHNLFTGIFDTFLTVYTGIVRQAQSELLKSLENYDAHTPHYALFLAFLKLFRFSREHLNTITGRHLDFYYREVLKLVPRPAIANKVHVLGELAKQVDEYLLSAGTSLKAGKDETGKEVVYQLDTDTVLNKAAIAELKTFYLATGQDSVKDAGTGVVTQNNDGRAFASPVTNSGDGLGGELVTDSKEWHPFVNKVYQDGEYAGIAMPRAELGFALASHYLYLTEGERKVRIRLVINPLTALNGKKIACSLTTEKGWYEVNSPVISSSGKKFSDNTDCTEISFTIPAGDPAIVNYNAAVHGGTFDCALPLLLIKLKNENANAYEYNLLKDVTISKVEIRVEVGADSIYNQKGIKNLLISNDAGPVDSAKPFLPFGSNPEKDASFIIGHKEIFCKKNASVKLSISWAGISEFQNAGKLKYYNNSATTPPTVKVEALASGAWKSGTLSSSLKIFNGLQTTYFIDGIGGIIPEGALVSYDSPYKLPGSEVTSGFIRLSLNSGFGYKNYIKDYSAYLIDKAANKPNLIEPAEPYTPKIKSIYVGYTAYTVEDVTKDKEADFKSREIRLFHLYPFGWCEQHKHLQETGDISLLPQFNHDEEGIQKTHAGEFYIGLKHIAPGQAVNMLFQVLEGSTNPMVVKPENHIHWSYLSDNKWVDFDRTEVGDNTLGLVQSGIISFTIPKKATVTNTVLPAGLIWLRASIEGAAEAVCKLLSINAQAAVVTFADNDNDPAFLDQPLPAGTISKLKQPDAAVKKLMQPYPSFGGRGREDDTHFYIRVSERLRHKARAVTVWDYEHLVLEEFPEIYKVKCLNHTHVDDGVYNEVKPGYVSIITIPSLHNRNDVNPLKPYTQQSTLTRIEDFLKRKASCFVKLRACQPQFEEVRLEFSLKLHDEYKDFTFYSGKLKEEITRFLSPWAFGESHAIDFGGRVYKSVLINFIEERYYVDYITDVFMYVKVSETADESGDLDEITASTGRSILVSAQASRHIIHQLTETAAGTPEKCFDS